MLIDPQILVAYLAAATALALSPGPDTMFVLASSTSGGARSGVAATFGISCGALVHATLAALGVSAVIAASPVAFDALRIAGALYLLWIGTLWLIALAVASGRAAQAIARNPRVRAWLDGVAGSVYIFLALRMFLLERRPA